MNQEKAEYIHFLASTAIQESTLGMLNDSLDKGKEKQNRS